MMRRLAGILARLYPRAWRVRYGAEFEALLEDAGVSLADLLDIAKGVWKMQTRTIGMMAAMVAIGSLLGFAGSFAIPRVFMAEQLFQFGSGPEKVRGLATEVMRRGSLTAVIERNNLFGSERKVKPFEDVIEKMKRSIRVSPNGDGQFSVSFTSGDSNESERVVKDLTRLFLEENLRQRGAALLVNVPLNQDEIAPNRRTASVIGLAAGLFAAMALIWFRRARTT